MREYKLGTFHSSNVVSYHNYTIVSLSLALIITINSARENFKLELDTKSNSLEVYKSKNFLYSF